jgi:hypothetical protein
MQDKIYQFKNISLKYILILSFNILQSELDAGFAFAINWNSVYACYKAVNGRPNSSSSIKPTKRHVTLYLPASVLCPFDYTVDASSVQYSSGTQMLLTVPYVDIARRTYNEYLTLPLVKHTRESSCEVVGYLASYSKGFGIESLPKYLLFCDIFLYFPRTLWKNVFIFFLPRFIIRHLNDFTILCYI